jgi:serine phosphatase RsbU (regulator of sigma subunit)
MNTPPGNSSPTLLQQVEFLEEGYRILSKARSLSDLTSRFEELLRRLFGPVRVHVAHRAPGLTDWAPPSLPDIVLSPPEKIPATSSLRAEADGRSLHAVRRLADDSAFWIVISSEAAPPRFSEADLVPFRLAGSVLDTAYQFLLHRQHEKGLVFSLNQRILQLNSLIDTGIEVAKLSAELAPHSMAMERAAALTNASTACVTISRGETVVEKSFFPAGLQGAQGRGTHCISADFTFADVTYTFELFDKESRNGPASFDGTDRLLLDALTRQVHASLENRYLHRQSLEKQRIEQDIAVAASIQQRILPEALPVITGYDAAGINIPSKSVGGDYYDCIPLPDGRCAVVIADVAGKGIPAALLVSSLHAYLNAYLEGAVPIIDLVRRLNGAIHRASTDDKFITAFVGVLTPATGVLEAVNAGHCTVYWRKADGTVMELSQGGIPLGMLGIDFPYQCETITLGRGDRLLLYTDGITEAHNEESRLYDTDGTLKDFFAKQTPDHAGDFIAALIADVKAFTGSAPQADDITALYLMRNG